VLRFSCRAAPAEIDASGSLSEPPAVLGQHYPNGAPFILVLTMDLARQLRANDAAASRYALHLAGLVVGQVWIAAAACGLVGTALGALVVDAACALTGANGYDDAPILGFCAGLPHRSYQQTAAIADPDRSRPT
jgi:hypothetical protein